MVSFNKVVLAGNLTRDPELRYTPGGAAVCEFSVAVNRKWKDQKSGQTKEEVGFFDCVAWGRTAEVVAEYMKKGRPILVEGRLTQDRWEDAGGQKRSRIKVTVESMQFLGDGRGGGGGSHEAAPVHEAPVETPPWEQ